jgi:hypothetical protein
MLFGLALIATYQSCWVSGRVELEPFPAYRPLPGRVARTNIVLGVVWVNQLCGCSRHATGWVVDTNPVINVELGLLGLDGSVKGKPDIQGGLVVRYGGQGDAGGGPANDSRASVEVLRVPAFWTKLGAVCRGNVGILLPATDTDTARESAGSVEAQATS